MYQLNQRMRNTALCAHVWRVLPVLLATAFSAPGAVWADDARALFERYQAQSGVAASAARGKQFYQSVQGGEWSCASCHGKDPGRSGQHASSGKTLSPLAPAFNERRFTDPAKTEKGFRRYCKEVAERECTDAEKADVLAYLLSVKP